MRRHVITALLLSAALPAQAQDTSILWDPGPRYRCYQVVEEHYGEPQGFQANPLKDTSECGPFLVPAREDPNCTAFGAFIGPNRPTCATWKFSTVGWYYQKTQNGPSEFRTSPGYDVGVTGGNGSPITARLVNKAYGLPDCNLREVAFSYEYPSSSFIKHRPDGPEYSLDDAQQFLVSYEMSISGVRNFSCQQGERKRNLVTTDFIYTYADGSGVWKKNVLSLVNFDPGLAYRPDAAGIYWEQSSAEGCRLMVAGPQVPVGGTHTVSVDFKDLVRRYSSKLCHAGGVPANARVLAVQIVNSNAGSDSTVDVKNIQAVFRNAPPSTCQVRYRVINQWSTGYTADIEISNSGAPINGWTLNWTLPRADQVTDRWTATVTQNGTSLSAVNGQWNGSLPTNGTATFGFNAHLAAGSSTPAIPTTMTLNGVSCRVN